MKKEEIKNLVFLGLLLIIVYRISKSYLPDLLSFIEITNKPGDDPPWYFILNDFKDSISSLIALIFSIIILIPFYIKIELPAIFLILPLLFYLSDIELGISILNHTDNIFNPELATTSWSTFPEYLKSTKNAYSTLILIILMFIYAGNKFFIKKKE